MKRNGSINIHKCKINLVLNPQTRKKPPVVKMYELKKI